MGLERYRVIMSTVILGDARQMNLAEFDRYGVIVADPPWQYDFSMDSRDSIEFHYPTLTLADIQRMPVSALSLPDSVLFLWGTWPKLQEANSTLAAWGFDYVTGFPWVKLAGDFTISYGMGYWVRGCSEYVLIGRRGNVSPPRLDGFLGLLSPNLHHSRKPASVHEIAEALPGPYLELFGRRPRKGWTVFGNEVKEETDDLPMFDLIRGDESEK